MASTRDYGKASEAFREEPRVFIDTEVRFRAVHSRFPETSLEIRAYILLCICVCVCVHVYVHNSENSRASVVESMKG